MTNHLRMDSQMNLDGIKQLISDFQTKVPSQPGVALPRVLLLALGPLKESPEAQEFLRHVIQAIKVHA